MDKQYTKIEIYNKLVEILVEDFEIDKDKISMEALLFEDLEFDSIDAVDLAVRLKQFTDKKIDPEEYKAIRTIEDIVNAIFNLI